MALSVGEIEATLKLRDELTSEVKKISGTLGGFQSTLTKMGGALAAAFSVQAITSAVTSFTDLSGRLTDLAAKTGISTTELQKLKYAAELSGGSLETVTRAIGLMARNLVEGDKSAVGAMKRLGLNIMEIRQMEPGRAFAAISDAIAKIPSPMEQSTLAMQLFGRSGAELLPMIKGNMTEVMQAAERLGIVMDEETVAAGDRLGDTFTTLSAVGQGVIGKILGPMVPALQMAADAMTGLGDVVTFLQDAFTTLLKWGIQALKFFIDAGVKVTEFAGSIPVLGRAMRDVDKAALESAKSWSIWFDDMAKGMDVQVPKATKNVTSLKTAVGLLTKEQKTSTKAMDEHGRELKRLADDDVKRLIDSYNEFAKTLTKVTAAIEEVPDGMDDIGRFPIDGVRRSWDEWGESLGNINKSVAGLGQEFKDLGMTGEEAIDRIEQESDEALKAIDRLNKIGLGGFKQGLRSLSMAAQGTIFGDLVGGASNISDSIDNLSGAFDVLQTAGTSTLAKVGAGFAVVAGQVLIAYQTSKLAAQIMEKIEHNAGNATRQFLRASDALTDMHLQLRLAGEDADALFNIKDELAFQAAFEKAQKNIRETNEAMEKYGLTWRDFSAVTGDFVRETAGDLVRMFDRLTSLGVDAEKLLSGMSGDLNQLIVDAVQTGKKVPAAMRPILEQLVRTKKLSEAAAAALLGIGDVGGPSFDDVTEAARRYGIELDALGPRIRQLQIRDLAAQIVKDFDLLVSAGGDVNGILAGMQDEVQEVITSALKLGLQLPESMRPIIEAMILAGLLTDEFGVALTDTSRLNFAQPLTEKIEELIDAIKALIDETDRYGENAVNNFDRARNAAIALGKAVPRGLGGSATSPLPGADPNASGGIAVPRGFQETQAGTSITVPVYLDGRQIAEASLPYMAEEAERLGLT